MNPRLATSEVANRESPQPGALHGLRLFTARGAWGALAALSVVLFVASLPVAYEHLSTVCGSLGCSSQLSPEGKNALEERWGFSMSHYALYHVLLAIFMALVYWTVGVVLLWMRSDDRLVLYASITLVAYGAMQPDTLHWLVEANPVWDLPVALVYFVGNASFFVLFCVFPDGRFVPRWMRWAAAAWIFYQLLYSFFPDATFSPLRWPALINILFFFCLTGSLVVAQIYRYRRVSDILVRQQTKWIVVAYTAATLVFLGVSLVGAIFDLTRSGSPELFYKTVVTLVLALASVMIPLSFGFAMLQYRAFVIRTLVYSTLINVVAAVYGITDLLLPSFAEYIVGEEDPSLTAFVSVAIIVVLFKPLRSRIEAGVNRLVDWLVGPVPPPPFIPPPSDRYEPPPFIPRHRIDRGARCFWVALPDLLRLRQEVAPPPTLIHRSA